MNDRVHASALAQAENLLDTVALRAKLEPDVPCFHVYGQSVTFRQLWERSLTYAANLAHAGVSRGDRVCLLLPTCEEFFYAFWGSMAAGAIPVPLYPTLGAEPLGNIFRDSGAKVTVAIDWFLPEIRKAQQLAPAMQNVVPPEDLARPRDRAEIARLVPSDVAFIQYTSGSTGQPKGVMLTHRGLLANIRSFVDHVKAAPGEVMVSWLPLYHDMGLIGLAMGGLYAGVDLYLLPPDLRSPRAWLEAVTELRATITASPDFGYRNCLRHIRDTSGLDLTSLRISFTGAEPIRPETVREFEERFGLKNVLVPAYGLAEATLAVTIGDLDAPLRVDSTGKWPSVGRPLDGLVARIGDGCRAGETGEIMVSGPTLMQGYYQDPEATREVLKDGWLATGDLGFLDDEGYLYVTGRKKDIIILAGENLAPHDVESIVDELPEVRYSAAVGIDDERLGTQRLVVVVEVREAEMPADQASRLLKTISASIHAAQGFRPGQVLLVQKGAIPKTTSGKIQHARLVEQIRCRALDDLLVYPRRGHSAHATPES
ncbi:MAG TPA: AMP-binding protein [Methylomirabilota bacterium]|nr:AMP-binding protein [Methylomirabilota bacterium]